MKIVERRFFKYLLCPLIFLASFVWYVETGRLSSGILLASVLVLYLRFLRSNKTTWLRPAWVLFIISTLAPFDISFKNYPGPPRFVPYFSGTPSDEAIEKIKRGELAWSGSCFVSRHEPDYIWVW